MTSSAMSLSKPTPDAIASVLVSGDLAKLTTEQRATHLFRVCESLGMNPWTRPFDYISFQGKTMMYARKDAAEQLRRIHGISVVEIGRERQDDIYIVTAKVRTRDGRTDEDVGVVSLAGKKGEDLANKLMAAVTKAKRRATLSVCGLGILDESELDKMQGAQRLDTPVTATRAPAFDVVPSPRPTPREVPHDPETGELPMGDGRPRTADDVAAELRVLRDHLPDDRARSWLDGEMTARRGNAARLQTLLESLERKLAEKAAKEPTPAPPAVVEAAPVETDEQAADRLMTSWLGVIEATGDTKAIAKVKAECQERFEAGGIDVEQRSAVYDAAALALTRIAQDRESHRKHFGDGASEQ